MKSRDAIDSVRMFSNCQPITDNLSKKKNTFCINILALREYCVVYLLVQPLTTVIHCSQFTFAIVLMLTSLVLLRFVVKSYMI